MWKEMAYFQEEIKGEGIVAQNFKFEWDKAPHLGVYMLAKFLFAACMARASPTNYSIA